MRPDSSATIRPLAFLPKSSILVWDSLGMDSIHLLELATRCTLAEYRPGCFCVDSSRDGRWLACGSFSSDLVIWHLTDGTRAAHFTAQSAGVAAVAFHPTKPILATCGDCGGGFKVWDISALLEPRCLLEDSATVNDLKFLPDGRLITGRDSGELSLWDVEDSRLVARASTSDLKQIKLLAEQDQVTITEDRPEITRVAVSLDGDTIAAGTIDGAVALYQIS
jgi:WD40 repeat protein